MFVGEIQRLKWLNLPGYSLACAGLVSISFEIGLDLVGLGRQKRPLHNWLGLTESGRSVSAAGGAGLPRSNDPGAPIVRETPGPAEGFNFRNGFSHPLMPEDTKIAKHRALRIAVVGIGILTLAATGVFLSGLTGNSQPDGVVALVNGRAVTDDYVLGRIEQLPLGTQIDVRENQARFIETLVTEEALLQSVLANDFADAPQLREQVKAVVAEFLIEAQVRNRIAVSEAQVRRYYDENQRIIRGETVLIRHILLAASPACEALMEQIKSLAEFEREAAAQSLDRESAVRGGLLGRVMDHDAFLGFEQEVFRMSDGEMRVFQSDRGCHLVRAGAREIPPVPPLESVSERIKSLLARQQEVELLAQLIARIEARIPIERYTP